MTEKDGAGGLPIIEHVEGVHYIGGETYIEGSVYAPLDMSKEEVRKTLAESHSVPPDAYSLGRDEIRRHKAGRVVVGSNKWRSNWDPHANIDPSQN